MMDYCDAATLDFVPPIAEYHMHSGAMRGTFPILLRWDYVTSQ